MVQPTPRPDERHLFIVAGYPASGKSSSLWKASQTGFPLFGAEHGPVVPGSEALQGVRENSGTAAKLQAGFWVTLTDVRHLNAAALLPRRLVLHLDLLLAYVLHRASGRRISDAIDLDQVFASLFVQTALRDYRQCTVTTLYAPLEEIQRRWRYRYPGGAAANCSKVLAAKDRLIMEGDVAAPLFGAIHAAWGRCLASLSRAGVLAGHLQARSRLQSDGAQAEIQPSAGSRSANTAY